MTIVKSTRRGKRIRGAGFGTVPFMVDGVACVSAQVYAMLAKSWPDRYKADESSKAQGN